MSKKRHSWKRIVSGSLLPVILAVCIFFPDRAVEAAEKGRESHAVKVGAFTSSGYHHKNADGSLGGYGYEYEALLAQYAGWEITYVEGTWSELQQMLEDGEIDLLGFLVETPEREKIYTFADYPSGTSISCLITGQENKAYAYEDYEAFDGMRVAYQKKNANVVSLSSWGTRNGLGFELVPYDSYQEVYAAIDNGSVDAGLATSFYDLSDYKIIANIGSADFYYAVTRGNMDLFQELNSAVEDIQTYYPNYETDLYSQFYETTNGHGETFTAEELEYLASDPVVTVLPGGRGAPFEIPGNTDEQYTGFVPDVLAKISELTGIRFQYHTVNNQVEYAQTHPGEDVISAMTCDITWTGAKEWQITQPYINAGISIIQKKGRDEIKTVGLQKENFLRDYIQQDHPEWIILTYDTMEERLDAVFDGKCDATLMNSYEAEYYLAAGKYRLLSEKITTETTQNIGFGVSAGSNSLLFSTLSKALLMVDSDTYDTMMRNNMNYSGRSDFFSLIYTNPVQVMVFFTIVLLLVLLVVFLIFYTISVHNKNRKIVEATQVKTDFFSRMSHDMRTPMNGILGMTALSKDENDTAVLHHNLEQIESSGLYMLSLINDTLDLQKLESGRMKLEPQIVYAQDYFQGLIEMMRPNADSKGIVFECENHNVDFEQYVELDPTRMKQIFVNLLSNAIKFTPPGGTVRFTAECLGKDGQIEHDRFCVMDTGIGMSRNFIEHGLFEPYSQEDSSITSKYGGTGLGLAITKNIITAAGGSISAESTMGEGTCFTVLLDFKIVEGKKKEIAQNVPKQNTSMHHAALEGKRILICEDQPLNAEIAKRILQKVGCYVEHVTDGRLGVERFESSDLNYFDAILMDVRMPNMDGLTAAKIIRALQRPDAGTIPIIAMTANAFDEDIRQSRAAGMNAHLPKPIDIQQLYTTIESLVASNEV